MSERCINQTEIDDDIKVYVFAKICFMFSCHEVICRRRYMVNILDKLQDVIFPTKCPICFSIINPEGQFCFECWGNIYFISDPSCQRCDYPFEFDIGADSLCASCIEQEHYFNRAISVMKYGDASKRIIHKLKYADKIHIAKNIASLMYSKLNKEGIAADFIVPVPMHRKKIRKRLYNQSALIANHLSRISNIPILANALKKIKHHSPQTGLRRELRKSNIKNTFSINREYVSDIHNKALLLVDDVYTTGATVDECSRILKQSYCSEVNVITLTRVI